MTGLDTLLHNADPARDITVPRPGSMHAERIWARVNEFPSRSAYVHRARWVVAPLLLVAAVTIALVLVGVASSPLGGGPTSAAAALRRLAVVASAQPALTLKGHQYLHSSYDASIQATLSTVGSNPTPWPGATVSANFDQWSDLGTATCTQATLGPATFSSPAAQAAWADSGRLDEPSPATSSSCSSAGTVASLNQGYSGAMNISSLPVEPSILARELTDGTTGIARIDQPMFQSVTGPDAAFQRAVLLLAEPTVGATPQFWSALLRAMSTFPGVTLLGTETTHTGTTGLAFAGENDSVRAVVVLSPSTGALLEARHINVYSFESLYNNLLTSFLPPAGTFSGGGVGAGFQWLDPIGAPSVVDSVPTSVGHVPPIPSAVIDVSMKPGTTLSEVTALMKDMSSRLEGTSTFVGNASSFELTVDSPAGQVNAAVKTLRASSIVASVAVFRS